MSARRGGMTLVEILVAVLILSVVSLAMVGILLTSTELFRRGEYGKSVSDESITVLAKLDDDLARMVPFNDGGYLYAESIPGGPSQLDFAGYPNSTRASAGAVDLEGAGNSVLAFVIQAKDPSALSAKGTRGRRLVAWWVESSQVTDGPAILWRAEMPAADADDSTGVVNQPLVDQLMHLAYVDPPARPYVDSAQVTSGVLHFGVDLDSIDAPRSGVDWNGALNALAIVDSESPPGISPTPPDAIRITIAVTGGGRFAQRGTLSKPLDPGSPGPFSFPVVGVKAVSTQPGSMLRIDDEWIGYDGYRDGKIHCDTPGTLVGRGMRRSSPALHNAGQTVWFGQSYALVRPLPH